jgi:hypothetical protein
VSEGEGRDAIRAAIVAHLFLDAARVEQEIEVPEHFPDDEQRLFGDRGRGPQVIRDLERAGAAALKRLDNAVAPAPVVVQPLADELGVRGDVLAMAGVQADERHRRRPPQALEVLDARPRAAARRFERRVDLRVRGDPGQQMVTDERDPLALVDQQRVGVGSSAG